jgi:hypothetical protein
MRHLNFDRGVIHNTFSVGSGSPTRRVGEASRFKVLASILCDSVDASLI